MSHDELRRKLFELMKILAEPQYALAYPVEPEYPADPWPTIRMAVARLALRSKRLQSIEAAADELVEKYFANYPHELEHCYAAVHRLKETLE